MTKRVYNFSAGPAVLPEPVLRRAQEELLALPGAGASVMEISHRSKEFEAILDQAKADIKTLLNIPDNYQILFLQGGSRLQFNLVPMNLLRGTGKTADYLVTGSWGKNAAQEAPVEGEVRVVWDGKETNYDRLPAAGAYEPSKDAAYLHFTSNETIQGVQFQEEPISGGAPLVCDASSDFLCRPLDVSKYGIIYACAQKNAGPAGVTVVIIRDDLLEHGADLPGMFSYKAYADSNSMQNTPPTFAVYMVGLVAQWLLNDIGGLDRMLEVNKKKCSVVYDALDAAGGFYDGHAAKDCRSLMNVTFRLGSDELQAKFLSEAATHDLTSLKGHRSVGGIRASVYNAMPMAGAETLAQFMTDFAKANG